MRILKTIAVALLGLVMMATSAFAAGSSTTPTGPTKVSGVETSYYTVKWDWVADDTDGSVPSDTVNGILGYVVRVITDPGATAPTDDYDITLTDAYGCDVMGGALADRDTTATEQAMPIIGGASTGALVLDSLTVNITGNSVNSATGTVYVLIGY
jgi:hypothetical protein